MQYKTISEELVALKFRKSIEREMEEYFESMGYKIIVPDMFLSFDDFLLSKVRQDSEETVKVLGGDSRIYILRPDSTTNILGKIFSKWEGKPPLKVYYNSRVFKNTPNGNIMENHQMGVESLGDNPQEADWEILAMAITMMEELKTPYVLELGSSKYLDSYLKDLRMDNRDELEIRGLLAKKSRHELEAKLEGLGLEDSLLSVILDMEGSVEEVIQKARSNYLNKEMEASLDALESLTGFLDKNKLLAGVDLDLSMIPDLDYYDGIIFKGYCQDTPKKVLSGGRYDRLTQKFGVSVSAIGFMIDMDLATQLRYREGRL